MISDQSQRDVKLPGKKIQFKSNSPFFRQQSPSKAEKVSFVSTGPFGVRSSKESRISAVYDNLSTGHLVL